jgi:hypothetical protein
VYLPRATPARLAPLPHLLSQQVSIAQHGGQVPHVSRFATDDVQVSAECDDGGAGGVQQCFQHP